jgi:hypothetical protein
MYNHLCTLIDNIGMQRELGKKLKGLFSFTGRMYTGDATAGGNTS